MFTVTLLLSLILMNCWTLWDPLEYYPSRFAPPRFLLFVSSPSHSSVCILFGLPHFARPASRKTELQKNPPSTLGTLWNTRVFWRFARKFHREVYGSELSKHWLAQIWTVARLIYKNKKRVLWIVYFKSFFLREQFLLNHFPFFKSYFKNVL